MPYTNVFGGNLIFPSQLSFVLITTAINATLQWPTEQQITGSLVVADFINVNATAVSLSITMPSALIAATGNKTTFNNVGANAFTVLNSAGGTLQTVQPGEQWVLVLTSNTTAAGTWSTFQMGASVSVASASALAGAGIKAVATTLNQKIDSSVKASTPITVVSADRAKCLIYTSGAGICNLPTAGVVGSDWFFMLRNSGSGTLNVLPAAGSIDGSASINMDPLDSCFIFTDGANFFTVGLSSGSSIAFDYVSIPVPGSGDFVLAGANLNRIAYRFTGALVGNRRIVVPNTIQQYWVDNETTGAFTLSVSTAAQVGPPTVVQGQTVILYCDSTNVINATSASAVVFPITIGQGGTGATTIAAAQAALQVPPTSRLVTAGAGMTGGGDLSADRTFDVVAVANGGIIVNANDLAMDIAGMTAETALKFDDEMPLQDVSVPAKRKATIANIFAAMVTGNVKSGTTSRNTTITPTDDPDLAGFALQPSSRYIIEVALVFAGNGATANGFRWQFDFNGQAGNVSVQNGIGWSVQQGGTVESLVTNGSAGVLQTKATFDNAGVDEWVTCRFGVVTGAAYTAGTAIDLQWAQGTSNGTNTSLQAGSFMRVQKVA
jgi:hypothetical protein